MEFLKNIKKLYAVSFFNSLILAYVIERLFYQERGMTVQLVVYLEIIYALTITVLEIPTGVLADKFGRKRLIVICSLFSVLEFSLLLFARNFFHFAFITFIAGVGHAFVSGSHNALVYDSLLCAGEERSFEKVLGRLTALEYTGHVLAALSGAVLASYFCFELNYIVSAVSTFIAFVITLTLKEPPVTGKPPQGDETPASAPGHTKQAFKVFKSQPLVLLYCVTGAVLASCAVYIYEFWQIVMEAVGVPVIFFGVISAAVLMLRVPGSLLAHRLKNRFSYKALLLTIVAVSSAAYAAVFITRNVLSIVPMMLLSLAAGVAEPLVAGYLHHHTESGVRATAESFLSLGQQVMYAVMGLVFGFISTSVSIFEGFLALGVICFGYLVYLAGR